MTFTLTRSSSALVRQSAPAVFPSTRRMPHDRALSWVITFIITALAAVSYFVGLSRITDYGTPLFDEKHYAIQAYQVLSSGHWIEDNPAYGLIVHPPVAKWFIGLSEWIWGYNPLGWRAASAISGSILVLLIVRLTRRLTRSTLVGAIAGFLALCDGVIFVSSRTALLDIFLTTFIVGALAALMVDRDQVIDRLVQWRDQLPTGGQLDPALIYGPHLGLRWWRILAAICTGLACGCKWSGVYFIFVFAIMSYINDGLARKRVGIYRPWLAVLRYDCFWSVMVLCVLPVAVYMGCWCFWFADETAYARYFEVSTLPKADSFITARYNPLRLIPALSSWWYYQVDEVLHFHVTLLTHSGKPHPWESKPWTWPMGLRPVLYYYQVSGRCEGCTARLMIEGTPTMWWPAFGILAYAIWNAVCKRRWCYTVALVGYLTGWLPWFSNIDRQMYFFYSIIMAPFLIMMIAMIIGDFLGITRQAPLFPHLDHKRRCLIVSTYLSITMICFLWLLPLFTGIPLSPHELDLRIWLPSWN